MRRFLNLASEKQSIIQQPTKIQYFTRMNAFLASSTNTQYRGAFRKNFSTVQTSVPVKICKI